MIDAAQIKSWREKKRHDFPNRTAWLRHIAIGPENREDVQAARRLLQKRNLLDLMLDDHQERA